MRIDVLTLFPDMFAGPLDESIVGRARQQGQVQICLHNIRDWARDRHRTVDDYPYGGGPGMVLKVEPVGAAVQAVWSLGQPAPVILLSPQGQLLDQEMLRELSRYPRLVLLCGHYEGLDERIRLLYVDREISLGDYVLTGGELPAMVLIDGIVRLLPGVLETASLDQESHQQGLLEQPHYTRPAEFAGLSVPEVLLSGHHANIAHWRRQQALRRTLERRPDLLDRARLNEQDRRLLHELGWDKGRTVEKVGHAPRGTTHDETGTVGATQRSGDSLNRWIAGAPTGRSICEAGDSMKTRLLLATNNPGKLREYRALLAGLPIELVTPAELGLELEVEESGQSYAENAALKARAFARASGLLSLADDSGLEVDALDGAPGLRSARYDGGSDRDRYQLLLERLADVPPERRTARFRCVIAIAGPAGTVQTCEGTCEGHIIEAPRGGSGFGYDPVFLLPERGRTMAELPAEEKNEISHRARAAQKARALLRDILV
ncbi:MAG: tRNA (guanosine(37)-N1)-methyltransferase TrmD [Chloroflexia bacterium]|nr:tRNA (guanosine(37)-N1)-methyltransferase TrmD [Chloroflexia bacterium]